MCSSTRNDCETFCNTVTAWLTFCLLLWAFISFSFVESTKLVLLLKLHLTELHFAAEALLTLTVSKIDMDATFHSQNKVHVFWIIFQILFVNVWTWMYTFLKDWPRERITFHNCRHWNFLLLYKTYSVTCITDPVSDNIRKLYKQHIQQRKSMVPTNACDWRSFIVRLLTYIKIFVSVNTHNVRFPKLPTGFLCTWYHWIKTASTLYFRTSCLKILNSNEWESPLVHMLIG